MQGSAGTMQGSAGTIHGSANTGYGISVFTQRQRDWEMLRYFYESMANSDDLFAYLGMRSAWSQP